MRNINGCISNKELLTYRECHFVIYKIKDMRFKFIKDALRHSIPSVAIPALWFSSLNTRSFQAELSMKPPAPLHPTDFMHGVLSAHSYESSSKAGGELSFTDSLTTKYNKHLKDWRAHEASEDSKSGYYGVIYVNEKTKQVVLVHRGTTLKLEDSIKKDSPLKTDIKGILHDEIVPQQIKAYELTREAVLFCRANGYELSITGHSLGAWLAELSGYYCHSDFKDELGDISHVRIVTFDSPGSLKTMKKFLPANVVNKRTQKENDLTDLDIVTYLSRPNLVNSCNGHVGEVIGLKVDIDNPELLRRITSFLDKQPIIGKLLKQKILANKYILDGILSLSGHSLVLILDQLDPDTGKPIKGQAFRVTDWPCLEYEEREDTTRDLKSYVDKIPNINPAVKMVMKAALDAGEHTTLIAVLSNLRGLASGIYKADQYWTTYEHIEQDRQSFSKADANSENVDKKATNGIIDQRREFLLKYQGLYRTEPYNPQKDLLSSEKHHSDYFLDLINRCNSEALGEKLGWWTDIGKQILKIKQLFKIDGHGYISSQDSRITIDEIRNWIRAVEKAYKAEHKGKSLDDILTETDTIHPVEQDSHVKSIASNIPYDRNKKFIEREKEQKAIAEQLHKGKLATITGLAGSGKSSLALEYAHKQKKSGTSVIWFKADSIESIITEYQKLADLLEIKNLQQEEEMLIRKVNTRLQDQKSKILLVIDNLEDYEQIKKYISNLPKNVRVLVTSRDGIKLDGVEDEASHIQLKPFDREKSIEYLKENIKMLSESQRDEIYRKISATDQYALPYELNAAVAFIKEMLNGGNKDLDKIILQITTESRYLFKSIDKDGLEWKLIQYLAYLDPDNICIDLLPELLGEERAKIKAAIAKLEKLSLVKSIHTEDGIQTDLSLHRLTQDRAIKYSKRCTEEAKAIPEDSIQSSLLEYFAKEFPQIDDNSNEERDRKSKELLPHVIKLVESYFDNKDSNLYKVNLLHKIGTFYQIAILEYNLALKYYTRELELNRSLYEENHPVIVRSLNNIGSVYLSIAEYEKALAYLLKSLEMSQRIHEGDHLDIAKTLNNIGSVYRLKAEYDKALEYYSKSQAISQRIFEGDHTDIAISFNNIGLVYELMGKYDEALENHHKSLKMREKIYQGDHSDIAKSLNNIGSVYSSKGEYEQALEYHLKSLEMQKRVYEGDHTDITASLNNIGSFYYKKTDYDKALIYFLESLEMDKRIHSGDHPNIAISLNNIALVYTRKMEYDEALKYFSEALAMQLKIYQGDHPDVALSLANLSDAYERLGDKDKSLEYKKQSYLIYKKFSDEGKKAKEVKKFLEENAPEFLLSGETRESIIKYGKFDEKIIAVQKKIQASILNKIHKLAFEAKWSEETWTSSVAGNWGILGYLDEPYLKRQVGESPNDLDAARMLIFEAINIGIMSSPKKEKDLACAKKFIEKYPELKARIIKEHPEYFVDGQIVRGLCDDQVEIAELLGDKNFDGKGLEDHDDFENIAPYWQVYSRDAMEKLMKLRIQDTDCEDNTEIIVPDFIWDGTENTGSKLENYLLAQIHQANESSFASTDTLTNTTNKIILVLNLYGKHWVGLVLDFNKESNELDITYLDPEQNAVPVQLESFLQNFANHNMQGCTLKLTHETCDKQKYNNCGSEVIELIAHNLTGYRESQEKATYLHSILLEMELLLGGMVAEII